MLTVTAIWIYMFFTTFAVGYGILNAIAARTGYRVRYRNSYPVCGLVAVTVYSQFFSLFDGVGLVANLILCICAVAVVCCYRKHLGGMLREMWAAIRKNREGERGKVFAILFLFLLFAYGASRGIIHYDTSLYHAQSIRWIEEYGTVRGLGNLHCRLAYNSSSFALSALYSMSFMGGQSYHCAAGWLAFVLAAVCLEMAASIRRGRLRTSDFARLMCVYYLVNIFDEMISPASDYFMVLTAFYIIIRWLDLLEEDVRDIFPYAMLCVLGVFLMTVKLSAALILLLVICPAYDLIKGRRFKETAVYLLLGIGTALPYLIRNMLISGWLVYPFTQIDLLDVAWKIPKGIADYDAREIQVFGRGYTDVLRYDIPIRQWLPDWYHALAGMDKCLVAAAAVSVCILLVRAVCMTGASCKMRRRFLPVQAAVALSFLFWLCTSPLMRYGCVYVYLTPAVVLGELYSAYVSGGVRECGTERSDRGRAMQKMPRVRNACRICVTLAVLAILIYKGAALGGQIVSGYENDYWIAQKDYENFPVLPYEINGVTFYYPAEGDRVGYESFPSAPVKTDVVFMGDTIRDGFMAADPGGE